MTRAMRYPMMGIVMLALVSCSAAPEAAPTVTSTPTASPAATVTASPTDLPTSTPTASPAATVTATTAPTATLTVAPVALDLAMWKLPLIAAGVTQSSIVELERLAVDQPEGMLGQTLGLGISLRVIDDALAEWTPGPEQAGYVEPLRANLAAVGGVVRQWYDGEISAADVAASLRPVRASSEQMLGDLRGDLRRLGVSAADLDALMAKIMAGF